MQGNCGRWWGWWEGVGRGSSLESENGIQAEMFPASPTVRPGHQGLRSRWRTWLHTQGTCRLMIGLWLPPVVPAATWIRCVHGLPARSIGHNECQPCLRTTAGEPRGTGRWERVSGRPPSQERVPGPLEPLLIGGALEDTLEAGAGWVVSTALAGPLGRDYLSPRPGPPAGERPGSQSGQCWPLEYAGHQGV